MVNNISVYKSPETQGNYPLLQKLAAAMFSIHFGHAC